MKMTKSLVQTEWVELTAQVALIQPQPHGCKIALHIGSIPTADTNVYMILEGGDFYQHNSTEPLYAKALGRAANVVILR